MIIVACSAGAFHGAKQTARSPFAPRKPPIDQITFLRKQFNKHRGGKQFNTYKNRLMASTSSPSFPPLIQCSNPIESIYLEKIFADIRVPHHLRHSVVVQRDPGNLYFGREKVR